MPLRAVRVAIMAKLRLISLVVGVVLACPLVPTPSSAGPSRPGGKGSGGHLFEVFRIALSTIGAGQDTFTVDPLAAYLHSALGADQDLRTETDYLQLCRDIPLLKARLEARVDSNQVAMALSLARGLERLGFDGEALLWFEKVRRLDPCGPYAGAAVRMEVLHLARRADRLGMADLARRWLIDRAGGDEAAEALLAGLCCLGEDSLLGEIVSQVKGPRPQLDFFSGLTLAWAGQYEQARFSFDTVLRSGDGTYPTAIKLASLLLAAQLDLARGEVGLAEKELNALVLSSSPAVRGKAARLLGFASMLQNRYREAQKIFGETCLGGKGPWQEVVCTLRDQMERAAEVLEGGR